MISDSDEKSIDWDHIFRQVTEELPEEEKTALKRVHSGMKELGQKIREAIEAAARSPEGRTAISEKIQKSRGEDS